MLTFCEHRSKSVGRRLTESWTANGRRDDLTVSDRNAALQERPLVDCVGDSRWSVVDAPETMIQFNAEVCFHDNERAEETCAANIALNSFT